MSDSEQVDWMEDEDAEEEDGSDAQAGGDNSASEGVTDYGGATDNETDFESDYEAPFDEILDAPGLLDTLQDTGVRCTCGHTAPLMQIAKLAGAHPQSTQL